MSGGIRSPDASSTPRGDAALNLDGGDLRAAADLAALALNQADKTFDESAGPAHHEVNAPALFEKRDQTIDRAGAERTAADQQRMETEHRAQALVAKIFGDEPVNAAIAFQPDQVASQSAPCRR